MQTHNLGYPRIGSQRELKKASEQYWAAKLPSDQLAAVGKTIRLHNWQLQKNAGIDLIRVGDFSFYDHVLDTSPMRSGRECMISILRGCLQRRKWSR